MNASLSPEIMAEIDEILGPEGKLKRLLPGYCFRPQQWELCRDIMGALLQNGYLIAEAGTGIGKSLAYLIPAAYYVQLTGEKVVVATKTKALQDQLINHDLPLVQALVPFSIKFAEARGRENYLCRAKWQRIIGGRVDLDQDQVLFVQSLIPWVMRTKTGDRKELDLDGDALRYWGLLSCDRFNCQNGFCGYEDSCFRLKSRKKWETADIIVTNHALLLTDAKRKGSLLPDYNVLIIDEAHQLPRQAQELFSKRLSLKEIRELGSRLALKIGGVERGLLPSLIMNYPHLTGLINVTKHWRYELEEAATRFFLGLHKSISQCEENYRFRLTPEHKERFLDENVWKGFLAALTGLKEAVNELGAEIGESEPNHPLVGVAAQLNEIVENTSFIESDWGSWDNVVWSEPEGDGSFTSLVSAPMLVGRRLADYLYTGLDKLVMVSATIATAHNFKYFISTCGLTDKYQEGLLKTVSFPSPFDYEKNVLFLVPKDMEMPTQAGYEQKVANVIIEIAEKVRRRTLVLFTSHQQMKMVADMIRKNLETKNIQLLVQNEDGQFSTLVAKMRQDPQTVLMGTETYWEGIDLPGDQLSVLVVVKLPFRSPADPFCQALNEKGREEGKSAFQEYMLPEAVLKLKQGIGRLIRSEHDRGVVVILDKRILPPPTGKSYGRVFLNSLPMKRIYTVKTCDIANKISLFMES